MAMTPAVKDVISSTGVITYPSTFASVAVNRCERYGNLIYIEFYGALSNSIAGSNALIATLPEGYRPKGRYIPATMYATYNNVTNYFATQIQTDGTIKTSIGSGTVTGFIHISTAFLLE